MAFTKRGSTPNPTSSTVMNGPGVNKMNPGYPGFPQMYPDTRTSGAVDHGAEISAAMGKHYVTKNKSSSQGISSKDHHLSKERRSRPSSMEIGSQIIGSSKVGTPGLPKVDTKAPLQPKLKTSGAPKINKSMAAGRVTSPTSGL